MSRRWKMPIVTVLVLIGGLLCLWLRYIEPIQSHYRWHDRVNTDIRALAHKRPPKISKGQWEFIVGWTSNLHGNCGTVDAVEPGWRNGFAAELEGRLARQFTFADIDWIWDEYARHTTYGQTYSDRWRPTRAEELSLAHEGCFGIVVD